MRDNSFDRTIERNYKQKWRFLIADYEQVKAGKSDVFKSVGEFYRHYKTCSQTFRKYYNRYLTSGDDADLLPHKRGPRWRTRRTPAHIEELVLAQRRLGQNKYEILAALREQNSDISLSPATIYRILRRHGHNRLSPAMTQEKRRIIKEKLGELGHVDLHQLSMDSFFDAPPAPLYVVSVIDSCSRLN